MSILENIGAGIVSVAIAIAGFLGYTPEQAYAPDTQEQALGADTQTYFGGQTYTLAGTGISSSATSFTLTSFTITQNGKKIQDSEMSDTFFLTFEPGSRSRQEFASCTTVTQNSDGTASISGCTRGLSPVTPYAASTSLQFAHGGGTSVIFSNTPQFYDQFAAKGNDETITGQWTFSVFPITASTSIASATTSGIVELATGGEAASSTLSGDIASSKLALHTGIATSAAPTSGNVVVVTGDDGNIDEGFLPRSFPVVTEYSASSTYTKSTTTKFLFVEMWGAGGGGGGGNSSTAGGGGGGAYISATIPASILSATSAINIGVGGFGGVSAAGSAGSSTYFIFGTTTLIAYGGAGGGSGGGGATAGGNGGGVTSHGTTTDNSLQSALKGIAASTLDSPQVPTTTWIGGGAGGATNGTNYASVGGNAVYGGAGGGAIRTSNGIYAAGGTSVFGGNGGTGVNGTGADGSPKGGGGGAGVTAGGRGGQGYVRITEYF